MTKMRSCDVDARAVVVAVVADAVPTGGHAAAAAGIRWEAKNMHSH
jgi:hypothetical protein